jgi:hypothetical protein
MFLRGGLDRANQVDLVEETGASAQERACIFLAPEIVTEIAGTRICIRSASRLIFNLNASYGGLAVQCRRWPLFQDDGVALCRH